MSAPKNGGPAFARPAVFSHGGMYVGSEGMTLRDYFAAAALTGLLASDEYSSYDPKTLAEYAYGQANAMLVEREGYSS